MTAGSGISSVGVGGLEGSAFWHPGSSSGCPTDGGGLSGLLSVTGGLGIIVSGSLWMLWVDLGLVVVGLA